MNPTTSISNTQVYGAHADYKAPPSEAQADAGVVPLDTLPAAWWNQLWYDITSRNNSMVETVLNIRDEILSVLSDANITPAALQTNQLLQSIEVIRRRFPTFDAISHDPIPGSVISSAARNSVSVDSATGQMTPNALSDWTSNKSVKTVIGEVDQKVDDVSTTVTEAIAAETDAREAKDVASVANTTTSNTLTTTITSSDGTTHQSQGQDIVRSVDVDATTDVNTVKVSVNGVEDSDTVVKTVSATRSGDTVTIEVNGVQDTFSVAAAAQDYKETEQNTGKKWINGDKVYSKTVIGKNKQITQDYLEHSIADSTNIASAPRIGEHIEWNEVWYAPVAPLRYQGSSSEYIGAEVFGSGYFKSTDKGSTWTNVALGELTVSPVTDMKAVSEFTCLQLLVWNDRVYAWARFKDGWSPTHARGFVFTSTDMLTWTPLSVNNILNKYGTVRTPMRILGSKLYFWGNTAFGNNPTSLICLNTDGTSTYIEPSFPSSSMRSEPYYMYELNGKLVTVLTNMTTRYAGPIIYDGTTLTITASPSGMPTINGTVGDAGAIYYKGAMYVMSDKLIKSTDDGASWSVVSAVNADNTITFDDDSYRAFYVLNNVVYTTLHVKTGNETYAGIYYSEDMEHWTPTSLVESESTNTTYTGKGYALVALFTLNSKSYAIVAHGNFLTSSYTGQSVDIYYRLYEINPVSKGFTLKASTDTISHSISGAYMRMFCSHLFPTFNAENFPASNYVSPVCQHYAKIYGWSLYSAADNKAWIASFKIRENVPNNHINTIPDFKHLVKCDRVVDDKPSEIDVTINPTTGNIDVGSPVRDYEHLNGVQLLLEYTKEEA